MADDFDPAQLDPPFVEEPEDVDPQSIYWAARSSDLLIGELRKKEEAYFSFVERRGFGQAWMQSYAQYYGLDPDSFAWDSNRIGFDGEQGELLRWRCNEYRSYLDQAVNMAIGQRPAFQALAENSSYESLSQVETADTAINWIYEAKYGERKERKTIVHGELTGLAWTFVGFDPDGGEEIDVPIPLPPELGGGPSPRTQKQRTGEIIIKSLPPWLVWFEPTIEDFDQHVYRAYNERVSKWELAARFPEHRERLLNLTNVSEQGIERFFGFDREAVNNTEELIARHWYHARTRALPEGRYVLYVADLVLYDGPLPFRELPFAEYMPSPYILTGLGYSPEWDLLPINQVLDNTISDIASIFANFGRPTVVAEDGLEFDPEALANGFRVLTVPPGGMSNPPQAINFAALPAGWEQFLQFLESKMQGLSGLNATARGQSDANISSGQMAALYHSVAVEINSAKQLAVDTHRTRVANLILSVLKDYLQYPLLMEMVGADERTSLKPITAETFKSIPKVKMVSASPLSKSVAGKLEMANNLLAQKLIETPQQYIEVMVSGQLKPLYRAPRSALLRIAKENEYLARGPATVQVPDLEAPPGPNGMPATYEVVDGLRASALENPIEHINEHLTVAAQSDDPKVVKATYAHIYDHVRAWKQSDPAVCALLGFPPPPSPMSMPALLPNQKPANDTTPEEAPEAVQSNGVKPRDQASGIALPKPAQPPPGAQIQS